MMMSDKPRRIFVDLWGKEITPPAYKQPDMTGIQMQDVNGQLKSKQQIDYDTISKLEDSLW